MAGGYNFIIYDGPDADQEQLIGEGLIERIEDEIAWGTFDTGKTFDIPAYDHAVGDLVRMSRNPPGMDHDYSIIMIGEAIATVIRADDTADGMEIAQAMRVVKSH